MTRRSFISSPGVRFIEWVFEDLHKGVFTADVLNGEDIILVDDILTTGATVREAVKILKKAGSRQV